jgi:signal transduction histidine kinase
MIIDRDAIDFEKFLLEIINTIPFSIVVIDLDYNVLFINDHAKSSHSHYDSQVTPLKCYQFSHHQNFPCEGDDHRCPHQGVLKTKEMVRVNHIHFDEHKTRKTVEITAIPILNKTGQVKYVLECTKDVSKQVRIEAALNAVFLGTSTLGGDDFFRSLVSHLATVLNVEYAIVGELTDSKKIRTLAVWKGDCYSDNFEYALKGTPSENIINTSTCTWKADIQTFFPDDKTLLKLNAIGYIGVPLTDSGGNVNGILAVLDTEPLTNEELSTQLLKVFAARAGAKLGRILSQKRQAQLEAQLLHAQKIESIGTLAGGIAHDFNNILTAIIGYSELSLVRLEEESEVNDNVRNILAASNRAKHLVQQILTFSRQNENELLPVRLQSIVQEVLTFLKASLPSHIDIRSSFKNDLLVIADATQVHQVVMNICTNACHAMQSNGGILNITLECVKLDSRSSKRYVDLLPGNHIKLTISDTGNGIPAENLGRIFDPYFTTKEKGKGTGLGLATVHGIVKSHNGAITVKSQPGKGSTFDVYLPSVMDCRENSNDSQPHLIGYDKM